MSETRELVSHDGQPLFERNSRDTFYMTLVRSLTSLIASRQLWMTTASTLHFPVFLMGLTVYLSDYCTPVSQVAARQHLRSAARHRLVVLRHRLSTYGRRAFAVAGRMTFNALADELRDPTINTTTFRRLLKTHFSRAIYTSSALEVKT